MLKFFLVFLFLPLLAQATSIDWTGAYRFEMMELDRPSLSTPPERKSYMQNYLGLNAKVVASDGFNIHSRFEVLGSSDSAYLNTQQGEVWGLGSTSTSAYPSKSNSLATAQDGATMRISQLYLNIAQEYGSIIAGRAPFHFGIGMNHHAGTGMFDHYMTVFDQLAYKFIVGNLYFMPMFSRVYDRDVGLGAMMYGEAFVLEYDSADSGSLLGVMLERRRSSAEANDVPINTGASPTNNPNGIAVDVGSARNEVSYQRTSFVLGRDWSPFGFRFEAGFINGDLGLVKDGKPVRWNAYGFASELYFPRQDSKWDYRVHFGLATGDDPDTSNYESFHFDRNYDVAFLLFNHRLGTYDILRTGLIRDEYDPTTGVSRRGVGKSLDDEAISNTFYLSPRIKYLWSDKVDLVNTLTFAQLMANPVSGTVVNKSLGFEWDIHVAYRIREKIQWTNTLGFLFPGSAFKVDTLPASGNSFTYGFSSRLGITF